MGVCTGEGPSVMGVCTGEGPSVMGVCANTLIMCANRVTRPH